MGVPSSKLEKQEFSSKVKMLLMGRPAVGKTSILTNYKDSTFNPIYEPSSGCNLVNIVVRFRSTSFPMLVMDSLADSDLNLACRLKSIQNTEILGLVFDLSNSETFEDVKVKLNLIKDNSYRHSRILLIGNKSDLDCQVSSDQISDLIQNSTDFQLEYFEVSAKTGDQVSRVFERGLEIGYYVSKARWDRVKVLLYLFKYSVPPEVQHFSLANLCEALPNMIRKKKKQGLPISLLPPEVLKRLIMMI